MRSPILSEEKLVDRIGIGQRLVGLGTVSVGDTSRHLQVLEGVISQEVSYYLFCPYRRMEILISAYHPDVRIHALCRELDLDPTLLGVLGRVHVHDLVHDLGPILEQATEGVHTDQPAWERVSLTDYVSEAMAFSWEIWCALVCVGSLDLLIAALFDIGPRHFLTFDVVGISQGRSCQTLQEEDSGDADFVVVGF